MNVPDLRDVNFDAYRQQALEMRRQAMDRFIDRLVASLKVSPKPHSRAAVRPGPTAACGA
jgi:hypothetical protein